MATTIEYIEYVCEQIGVTGDVRYKKMFGEYIVYINDKPILVVCDNTVFVKKHELINEKMLNADTGYPYKGAKEHYVLDIDNSSFSKEIIEILEPITPLPKRKNIKN